MTKESYYGENLESLEFVEQSLKDMVAGFPTQPSGRDIQPILYSKFRIKEPDSMMEKLRKHGLPTDPATALAQTHDAVGARIVCSFLSDVMAVAEWLRQQPNLTVLAEKNYILYPKPNGYRSLHLIVRLHDPRAKGIPAEIQLRTIALDFWASLEHQMKYKRNLSLEGLIRSELKRCADEIASIDLSMQTLQELINQNNWI